MRPELRKILDDNCEEIVQQLDVESGMLRTLLSAPCSVLSAEQKASIESKPTQNEKVDKLLDTLKRGNDEHFFLFCDALGEHQLASILREQADRAQVFCHGRKQRQAEMERVDITGCAHALDRMKLTDRDRIMPSSSILFDNPTASNDTPVNEIDLENCTLSDIGNYVIGFKKVRYELVDCMDPENGLLDCLSEYEIISDSVINDLESYRDESYRDVNRNLLRKHIAPNIESCCILFLKALKKNEQEHIVKFIISSVPIDIGWNDRMLTGEERNFIDRNTFCLMNLINPYSLDFLDKLAQAKCFTREHKDRVVNWYRKHKNVHELLKILERRTYNDFNNFKKCLSETMQNKLIDLLDKGRVAEVSVKILKQTDDRDKKVIENRLIEILTGYVDERRTSQITPEQRAFIDKVLKELEDAGIHFIGNCRSHSMALYFKYYTDESLQFLISFCQTGSLKALLERLYKFLLDLPEGSPCLLKLVSLVQYTGDAVRNPEMTPKTCFLGESNSVIIEIDKKDCEEYSACEKCFRILNQDNEFCLECGSFFTSDDISDEDLQSSEMSSSVELDSGYGPVFTNMPLRFNPVMPRIFEKTLNKYDEFDLKRGSYHGTGAAILSEVHTKLESKDKRAYNVVIKGLPISEIKSDATQFTDLCISEFNVRPTILSTTRLDTNRISGQIPPLLVTLKTASEVNDLVSRAKSLRCSKSQQVRDQIYLNPYLSYADALTAFKKRSLWRSKQSIKNLEDSNKTDRTHNTDLVTQQQQLDPEIIRGSSHNVRGVRSTILSPVPKSQNNDERACNVVITGMPISEIVSDATQFTELCIAEFKVRPTILSTTRLDTISKNNIHPLLVSLSTPSEADHLVSKAKKLRHSKSQQVRDRIYLNRHLTYAETLAAFNERSNWRSKQTNQNRDDSNETDGTHNTDLVTQPQDAITFDPGFIHTDPANLPQGLNPSVQSSLTALHQSPVQIPGNTSSSLFLPSSDVSWK